MFADYHIHSNYSDDSTYPMRSIVEDAIVLGIEEICFTDHYDLAVHEKGYVEKKDICINMKKYSDEIEKLQRMYKDRIKIKKGVEFGVQYETIPQYQRIAQDYPLDFILLSVHQIANKGYWNRQFQQGKTEAQYYHAYYQALYAIVQNFHDYNVLAHVDLIRRYDNNTGYDVMNDREMIEKILTYIIADGKGIEVNTSSIRYGIGDTTPAKSLLMLYKELGGRIVTIGSDSHKPIHLGAYVEEIKGKLKQLGFHEFATFEQRVACMHRL